MVAATVANGGVTVDPRTGAVLPPDDRWYLPRHPDLTRIVPLEELGAALARFAFDHADHLRDTDLLLGTWFSPDTKACYLDLIVREETEAGAIDAARRYSRTSDRHIVAICNPRRGQTIFIPPG